MIRDETLETVWKRTATCAKAFRAAMVALGLELFSHSPADSVSAIKYPAGVTDKAFRNGLKTKHNVHVAGGQGTMEGAIFRVNHMGYSDAYDALAVVAAIEHVLHSARAQAGTGRRRDGGTEGVSRAVLNPTRPLGGLSFGCTFGAPMRYALSDWTKLVL